MQIMLLKMSCVHSQNVHLTQILIYLTIFCWSRITDPILCREIPPYSTHKFHFQI